MSESQFYENSALWSPERYGGLQQKRAEHINLSVPTDVRTILDVGCGNGVVTNELRGFTHVFGVERSRAALFHVDAPCCQAEVSALPFEDCAFDLLLSSEVLEHLPHGILEEALSEMVRVTRRYILVTVPYCEKRQFNFTRCPLCGCQFHPNYHHRCFKLADLERLFEQWASVTPVTISGLIPIRVPVFGRELTVALSRQRLRKFPWYAVCPQCGFMRGNGQSETAFSKTELSQSKLKALLRGIWPKKTAYRWWLALYEVN